MMSEIVAVIGKVRPLPQPALRAPRPPRGAYETDQPAEWDQQLVRVVEEKEREAAIEYERTEKGLCRCSRHTAERKSGEKPDHDKQPALILAGPSAGRGWHCVSRPNQLPRDDGRRNRLTLSHTIRPP